jgi:hypothetical protein
MTSVRTKIEAVVAATLVLVGLALLALPRDWIERGDDGAFELALGLVPLVCGVALAVRLALRGSGGRSGHLTLPVRSDRTGRR